MVTTAIKTPSPVNLTIPIAHKMSKTLNAGQHLPPNSVTRDKLNLPGRFRSVHTNLRLCTNPAQDSSYYDKSKINSQGMIFNQ